MRNDTVAAVSAILLVGLIILLAVVGVAVYAVMGGFDYTADVELTLYTSDAAGVYRADMHLEVDDATFIDHLWTGSITGDGGLPEGDHDLNIQIWEGQLNDRKQHLLSERSFDVAVPGESQSTYTISMPIIKLEGEATVVHLWGYVSWDGKVIREASWSVNPGDGTVTEG